MQVLQDAELKRIEAAVAEVEKSTEGEIVTVVAGISDDYAAPRLIFSALFSAALVTGVHFAWPVLTDGWFIVAQLVLWPLCWLLTSVPAVLRMLVSDETQGAAVHRAAQVAFVEKGVHRTRGRTGVLLYISEAEHRVEILADEGIHARVGVEGWEKHVKSLIASIRAGNAGEGICAIIKDIGVELAAMVPASSTVNELANAPVVQKRG